MSQVAVDTVVKHLDAAGAEMRALCDKPLHSETRLACKCCGMFFAEPNHWLCRPCIDTYNACRAELQRRQHIGNAGLYPEYRSAQ